MRVLLDNEFVRTARPSERFSRVVTLLTGVGGLVLACLAFFDSLEGSRGVIGAVVLIGSLMALGFGLLLHQFWARRLTAALCLLVAIFMPFGLINPHAAMELARPPTIGEILAWLVPLVVGLLALAWLIDPPQRVEPSTSLKRTRGK